MQYREDQNSFSSSNGIRKYSTNSINDDDLKISRSIYQIGFYQDFRILLIIYNFINEVKIILSIFTPAIYELAEVGSRTSLSHTRSHSVTIVSVNMLLSYIHPVQLDFKSSDELTKHANFSLEYNFVDYTTILFWLFHT